MNIRWDAGEGSSVSGGGSRLDGFLQTQEANRELSTEEGCREEVFHERSTMEETPFDVPSRVPLMRSIGH